MVYLPSAAKGRASRTSRTTCSLMLPLLCVRTEGESNVALCAPNHWKHVSVTPRPCLLISLANLFFNWINRQTKKSSAGNKSLSHMIVC